ncbi:hypothetical protein QBC38DRAFT_527100 [Podospora fimiseda]|uniref:Uncharacterized protein n=1 Tax=Podospora fimiseda TaxID=252190 RepID=A0AAN7BPB7_9PEZI|nr:hypothetical protein QBC38DRAFT_527100 [Podospora fimiseda]
MPLSPGCPPPPAIFSPKVRSITPKPTIFSSLGDAHLAITSRLVSRSAAQTVPHTPFNSRCGSPVNPLEQGKAIDVLSNTQHMELATNSHVVNGRCLTGYAASSPAIVAKSKQDKVEVAAEAVLAHSTDSHRPESYNDDFDPDRDWMNGPGPDINSIKAPRETGSTVISIYRQYLPSTTLGSTTSSDEPRAAATNTANHEEDGSYPSENNQEPGSEKHYVLAGSPSLESVEIEQTNGRNNSGNHCWQLYSTPGYAPSVPLPELPQNTGMTQLLSAAISDDTEPNTSAVPSTDSVSNSQLLLNGITKEDQDSRPTAPAFAPRSDLVPPSRTSQFFPTHCIESERSPRRAHEYTTRELYLGAELSQAALSTGGVISESDEDPFQYDRNSYGLFLRRAREREVSAALEHIENSSIPSPGKQQQPVLDQHESSSSAYSTSTTPAVQPNSQRPRRPLQSNNPFLSRLDHYHTSPPDGAWEETDEPYEVRIPVQQPLNRTPAPKSPEVIEGAGLTIDWNHKIYSEGLQNVATDGGDWETVGTEVGQFDSNRACASGTGLSSSRQIKFTGSSIADYSDISDFAGHTFDAFASTERILQHPGGDCGPNNRVLRNLKDTGRPIFLPKPRIHRVNGYPQDSCRIFTDPTAPSSGSGSSARSQLLEKLKFSKRMRRHNETTQEPPRSDPFKPIKEHRSTDVPDLWSRHGAVNGYAGKGKAKDTTTGIQPTNRESSNANKENRITPMQGATSPAGSPTLFSFPLITLEEAAKKQATRIANGEDDLTITSGCRTRQDSSAMSSRATQRTTPPTPCISKPTPVHYRNRTDLGLPDTAAHYPGYSFDKAFGGDGRNTSIISTLSSASPPIPGRAVFPRSCRNPLGFSRGSMRSSFSFPNRPPVTSSPVMHETPDRAQFKKPGRTKYKFSRRDTGPRLPRIVDEETADARRKRQVCYYFALVISVFPFMAVLVYKGMFNTVLSWYTQGEIGRFTHKQRHTIGIVGSIVAALWLVVLAVMVTLLVSARR